MLRKPKTTDHEKIHAIRTFADVRVLFQECLRAGYKDSRIVLS